MQNPIRILLCDDSAVLKKVVRIALEADPHLKVVEEAKDGQDAIDKLPAAKPDIIIMDVEMPVMDGIDAVREIRKRGIKIPIIMFSSLTSRGAEATLDAIAAGANDFATKPVGSGHFNEALEGVRRDLIPKVFQWGGRPKTPANPPNTGARTAPAAIKQAPAAPKASAPELAAPLPSDQSISAIGIGVSTGGPQALSAVVSDLPVDFPVPILIAQHMPPVFTGLLAERLSALKGHTVREAVDGEVVKPGEILIAPGDHHLLVRRDKTVIRAQLNQEPPENSCRPSVDPLFRSIADTFGNKAIGIVLTGMGNDGANGCQAMRQTGAKVIVQDEETSVIWGMPGNVARRGLADRVLPLNQIATEMTRITKPSPVAV